MDSNKNLRAFESKFFSHFDEKYFSFDLKRPNPFTDIVFVTAVKTQQTAKVYFDSVAKEVGFWNDSDEEFVRPLNERGIADLADAFYKEIVARLYFCMTEQGETVAEFYVKAKAPIRQSILEILYARTRASKKNFDAVLVTDFLGNIHEKIRRDANSDGFVFED